MAKRPLTDQQLLFLEALFGDAKGNAVEAKKIAGYHPTYPTSSIVKTLEEDIIERTKQFLSGNAPKAAVALVSVLDNPEQLGAKDKVSVAKDILDRTGVSKMEKLDIGNNGIFILPAKKVE